MCGKSKIGKNILITGASGFIGSFMVETALASGYKVWAGVRANSNMQFLPQEDFEFIDLHYQNIEQLATQIQDIDYVIHCAGVTKALKEADFNLINYQYAVNLCEAIQLAGNKVKKIIQISSLSVMGEGDEIDYTPFSAAEIPHPNTHYGKSKWEFERYLKNQNDTPYIILRPTGVYGPREKDYLMMLKSIQKGLNIKAGFKPQQLTFIYVQDLVDAAFLALESEVKDKTYLLSDGNTYSDDQYSQFIKELLPKQNTINIRIPLCLLKIVSHISQIMSLINKRPATLNPDKYKIMKQRNWKCDTSDIVSDLNFQPKYNLHQGLRASINWYKINGWL